MTEWTVHIETAPGLTTDEDAMMELHDALNSDPVALGPAVSGDLGRQTLAATYQVEAATMQDAASIGIAAFQRALAKAGLEDTGGSVHVGPFEDAEPTPSEQSREAVPA